MLNHIFDWARGGAPPVQDDTALRRAVSALLMEAARVDDTLDTAERERIQALLAWRFNPAPLQPSLEEAFHRREPVCFTPRDRPNCFVEPRARRWG